MNLAVVLCGMIMKYRVCQVKYVNFIKFPYLQFSKRQCKIVCVFGKKHLFFGKNQDITILIEKEVFYASNKTTNTTDYCR